MVSDIKEKYCMCEELGAVARDGKSTCGKCGGIDAYGAKSRLKIKDMIDKIMDWCSENNTVPYKDLNNLICECGHSLLEHGNCPEDIDLINKTGKGCTNKFCNCKEFKLNKRIQNSTFAIASTDGGWVNVLKLKEFLESE